MSFTHKLEAEVLERAGGKNPRQNGVRDIYVSEGALLIINRKHSEKTNTPQHIIREDHLCDFMDEISKAIRGVQFAYRYAYERWVYMPDEPYPMGYIGYGDYRVNQIGDDQFGVCSRKIENVRYQVYSDQYHMKMSTRLKAAVRNAKKFLRDYKVTEIADINGGACRNKWGTTNTKLTQKIRAAREGVVNEESRHNDLLHMELEALVAGGHKFLNPEFNDKVSEFLAAHEERKEALSERTKRMLMVSVEQTLYGSTLYCMASTENIDEWGNDRAAQETCTEETLPSKIAGQLSVLNMCKCGQYVDDVGYKASESCFYVVR